MSLSFYDQFTGNDWQRYSLISSKITCIGCIGIGIIALFTGSGILISLWTILSGLLIAVWEYPIIFRMVPNFDSFKEHLMKKLFLQYEEARAVLLIILSSVCFINTTICLICGLMLIVTAILYGFAAINRRSDEQDGMLSTDDGMGYEQIPSANLKTTGLLSPNYHQLNSI